MSTAKLSRLAFLPSAAVPRIEGGKDALGANGNGQQAERNETQVGRPSLHIPPARAAAQVVRERAEECRGLAERLAQVHYHRGDRSVPLDDLLSEAHLGLVEAVGRFDEGRGVPLGAFVTLVVRRRLNRAVQRWRRQRERQVCFTELDGSDRAGSTPGLDPADPRTPEPDVAAAVREALDRVRRVLPERWFALLQLHDVEERTLEEISRQVGVSRQRVRQLIDKAVKWARCLCPTECGRW